MKRDRKSGKVERKNVERRAEERGRAKERKRG